MVDSFFLGEEENSAERKRGAYQMLDNSEKKIHNIFSIKKLYL